MFPKNKRQPDAIKPVEEFKKGRAHCGVICTLCIRQGPMTISYNSHDSNSHHCYFLHFSKGDMKNMFQRSFRKGNLMQ